MILIALLACVGCGAHAASLRLRARPERLEPPSAWAAVMAEIAPVARAEIERRVRENRTRLVVTAGDASLVASLLEPSGTERERWRLAAAVVGSPVFAGELVLYGTRDEIVAVAADGARRWSLPARGQTLLAATRSGERTALLLGDASGQRSLSVSDDAGHEGLRVTAEGALGVPVLLGDVLLAPFGAGNVAAIDANEGGERARTRLGAQPLHALLTHDGPFFGGPPWVALDGASYALPRRPLPGLVLGGSEPTPPGPHDTVTRLYVRPTRTPGDDVYTGTYGRVAFGLERERGTLLWVLALPGHALAGALVPGGLLVCDDSGALRLLAADSGKVALEWQLVRRRRSTIDEPALSACALGPELSDAPPVNLARATREPSLEQLAGVLGLSDPTLTDAQRFLSRELAARPEPEATRVLIDLVRRRSLDRVLQSEAEDLLAIRRNGQDYMLAALTSGERAGDATAVPPIAPLGEALAALGERRAAPLLARQMNRPAHSAAALARAASALEQLASVAEYDELSVFFSLHRTTADSPELVAAVVSVGSTLLRIDAPRARRLVSVATRDPLTVPDVRAALEHILSQEESKPSAKPDGSDATGGHAERAEDPLHPPTHPRAVRSGQPGTPARSTSG